MRKELRDDSGGLVSLETEPTTQADVDDAAKAGLELIRRIDQLRIPLPLRIDSQDFPTRAFVPGVDDDAFLRVNNRAFAWHPDQSNWTNQQLNQRINEPWFRPEGFLLHEIDGVLAGFCWTKVHPSTDVEPELGEIFVIAVDPKFHGLGLGRSLTIAGLRWLESRPLALAKLHVEHDNLAAQSLYRELGFVEHDSHCWWASNESTPK